MHMLRIKTGVIGLIGMTLVLAACAAGVRFNYGNSRAGFTLTYRSTEGASLAYYLTTTGTGTSERDGQAYESSSRMQAWYTLADGEQDSLLHYTITIDSMKQSLSGAGGDRVIDLGFLSDKRGKLEMSPLGKFRNLTPIDSIIPPPGNMFRSANTASLFRFTLFPLPDRPLHPGDTWQDQRTDTSTTADSTRGYYNTAITDMTLNYTVVGEEEKAGFPCLHLTVEREYSRYTTGSMAQIEMTSEGDGLQTSDIWFAYRKGVLVELTSENFYEGTTAYSGQMTMTIPQTTESKTVLKLL